jgi:hypothetical protein
MATHLRDSVSIEVATELCDGIAAALESDHETSALAATWQALTAKGDGLGAEARAQGRATRRARARLLVVDGRWDREVAAFGRAVVDAADGNRESALYGRFFGKLPPSSTQVLGVERELEIGARFLTELARDKDAPLAVAFMPRLDEATSALRAAVSERASTLATEAALQTSIALFLDDVNRELDRTEGALLGLFPGERPRVASYIAITRHDRRGSKRAAEAEEPGEPVS